MSIEKINYTSDCDEVTQAYSEGLPPLSVRLLDPTDYRQKLDTPTLSDGQIDIDRLFQIVNGSVDQTYRWPKTFRSVHHLYWPGCLYEKLQEENPDVPYLAFRDLPANKVGVPRDFENWLHTITKPPEVPSDEVITDTVRLWNIMPDFHNSLRALLSTQRLFERERERRSDNLTPQQREILNLKLQKLMKGLCMRVQDLSEIPIELWPFTPDLSARMAAGHIGSLVIKGHRHKVRAANRRHEEVIAA